MSGDWSEVSDCSEDAAVYLLGDEGCVSVVVGVSVGGWCCVW